MRSSMFMSLNSLDSKISPHSLHSTNSDSSSRLTICTRGCLQGCFVLTFEGGTGDFAVMLSGESRRCTSFRGNIAPEFLGIVERPDVLSSPLLLPFCEFTTGYLAWAEMPSLLISDCFRRIISTRSAQSTYHSMPSPSHFLLRLAPGFSGNVQ